MIVAIASPATTAFRTPREAHGFIPIHKHNHQEDEVAVDLLIGASVKTATDEPSLDRYRSSGPSMATAFNVSPAVRFAGKASPFAFGIATIALGMVAVAFGRLSRRVAHAGLA